MVALSGGLVALSGGLVGLSGSLVGLSGGLVVFKGSVVVDVASGSAMVVVVVYAGIVVVLKDSVGASTWGPVKIWKHVKYLSTCAEKLSSVLFFFHQAAPSGRKPDSCRLSDAAHADEPSR